MKVLAIVLAAILMSSTASLLMKTAQAQAPTTPLNLGSPVFVEHSVPKFQKEMGARTILELTGNGTLYENGTTIKTTDRIYANALMGSDGVVSIHGRAILNTAEGGQAMAIFYQKIDTNTGKQPGVTWITSASGNLKFLKNEILVLQSADTGNGSSTQTFWLVG